MKTVKTPKGTDLPLTNLKGKDYLMVAYRLIWLNEEYENFSIETEFLEINEVSTTCRATVQLFDKDGKLIRKASGTKHETKVHFHDHTEKAETGAIGRALVLLGFGTQFAIADLDEGTRVVDSPIQEQEKGAVEAPVEKASINGSGHAITEAQLKRLFAICNKSGWTHEQLKAYLKKRYGISSSKEIRWQSYQALCAIIEKSKPEELLKGN